MRRPLDIETRDRLLKQLEQWTVDFQRGTIREKEDPLFELLIQLMGVMAIDLQGVTRAALSDLQARLSDYQAFLDRWITQPAKVSAMDKITHWLGIKPSVISSAIGHVHAFKPDPLVTEFAQLLRKHAQQPFFETIYSWLLKHFPDMPPAMLKNADEVQKLPASRLEQLGYALGIGYDPGNSREHAFRIRSICGTLVSSAIAGQQRKLEPDWDAIRKRLDFGNEPARELITDTEKRSWAQLRAMRKKGKHVIQDYPDALPRVSVSPVNIFSPKPRSASPQRIPRAILTSQTLFSGAGDVATGTKHSVTNRADRRRPFSSMRSPRRSPLSTQPVRYAESDSDDDISATPRGRTPSR